MSTTLTKGSVATSIRTDGHGTHIRYHNTDVVSFTDTTITLRTGGWYTVTTKRRMNQASNQFGLNIGVSQDKGQWYVSRWLEGHCEWVEKQPFDPSGVHVMERR